MAKDDVQLSKFLALVLRHEPQRIGLSLDPNGWADIGELIERAGTHGVRLSESDIERVVSTNSKQRYTLDAAGRRIRANQGHSITVDLELEPTSPPLELFHGTARHNLDAIRAEGLLPMSRQHVHLSADRTTALTVGRRHGEPCVLAIDAATMHQDGLRFYMSANGVWLTDAVPARYLRVDDLHP